MTSRDEQDAILRFPAVRVLANIGLIIRVDSSVTRQTGGLDR